MMVRLMAALAAALVLAPTTPAEDAGVRARTVPADAIAVSCLGNARAWSQRGPCPRMPVDPFDAAGARPLLLYRVR